MKVVFATAEISPIAKTGGLGDVCGSLPKALAALGHDITLFLPFYRDARRWLEENRVAVEPLTHDLTLAWANWIGDVGFLRTTLPGTNIPLILVVNDFLFDRDHLYSSAPNGIQDFLLRYTFFCRAVIRGCEILGIAPDILHCHDWHTALLPVYLHSGLRNVPNFAQTRSVFTIHNLNYQGAAGPDAFALTGLHHRYWAPDAVEHFRTLNPMKGGIFFADEVTTVSPNYAREIQTPEYGAGLDGVLRHNAPKLTGILNGIDTEEWNPATDRHLLANYDADTLRDKARNKRALAKEAGFRFSAKTPIFCAVSRLVSQKGFQHLIPVLPRLLEAGAQLVILGSGEQDIEEGLSRVAQQYPDRCRVFIGFDNALAHRIYAGSDMLLMPSDYEPCGLNQMYAMRYGVVPVVRLTGGLADTVIPFDGSNQATARGFGYTGANERELHLASWIAMLNFRDPATWQALQMNGMMCDFSWERSAREYDAVYRRIAER